MNISIKKYLLLLAVTLPLLYGVSYALTTGPYIDGKIGYSSTGANSIDNLTNQKKAGPGFNINAGYFLIPNIAIEAGYTYYQPVKYQSSSGSGTTSLYSYHLAIKAVAGLPIGPYIFGKVGLGVLNQNKLSINNDSASSKHNANLYWGAGIGYNIILGLYTELEFSQMQGGSDIPNAYMLSAGVGYNF